LPFPNIGISPVNDLAAIFGDREIPTGRLFGIQIKQDGEEMI
jgi:hypothetical protein